MASTGLGAGGRRLRRWSAALAALLAAGWLGHRILGAFDQGRHMPGADVAPVRVARAVAQDVPHYLSGLGTVLPSSDVLVRSRVDGQLMRLHFEEGARVRAGDLLAEIDPRPFEAALAQAQGQLRRDEAQLSNARRDLARYARLARDDYIATQQRDTQAALVAQYEGAVQADRAAVEQARLNLEYSRVRAPASGRLGLRQVDVGNQIKSSDSAGIVRIAEDSPCDVLFTLPEVDVGLISAAIRKRESEPALGPLTVLAYDRDGLRELGSGSLLSMDNQIDAATGTVKLKARFANADGALFPSQFVNARLLVQVLRNVVTVPSAAVQLGSRGRYVYLIDSLSGEAGGSQEGIARFRLVRIGLAGDRLTVIEDGVAAGDLVAVDGLDRLRDGMRVRIAATVNTPAAIPDTNP